MTKTALKQKNAFPPLLFPELWSEAQTVPCTECGYPILLLGKRNPLDPFPQWHCLQHETADPRLPFHWPLFYRSSAFPYWQYAPCVRDTADFPLERIVGDNWATEYSQGWLEQELYRDNRSLSGGYPRGNNVANLRTGDFNGDIPPASIAVIGGFGYVGEGNHRIFVARMHKLKEMPQSLIQKYEYTEFLATLQRVTVNFGRAVVKFKGYDEKELTFAAGLERLHTLWWRTTYGGYPTSFGKRVWLLREKHPWLPVWFPDWMPFAGRAIRLLYFANLLSSKYLPDWARLAGWQIGQAGPNPPF